MESGDAQPFVDAALVGQSVTLLPNGSNVFDVEIVLREKRRIVTLGENTQVIEFPNGKFYSIPKGTKFLGGSATTETNTIKVRTGMELAHSLDVDVSFSGSYAGVSASASAQYSYSSSLSASKVYAVVSVDHRSFLVEFDYDEPSISVNPQLLAAAKKLPDWRVDPQVYQTYFEFFNTWGTHVIHSCVFGARYQLRIEHEMTKTETKHSFEAHVKAEYNGIAKVSGSVDVKGTQEYRDYKDKRETQVKVHGGSSSESIILSRADPDDEPRDYKDAFEKWSNTLNAANAAALVNLRVDSIGNTLKKLDNPAAQEVAQRLIDGLEYISNLRCVPGHIICNASTPTDNPEFTVSLQDFPGMKLAYLGPMPGSEGKISPLDTTTTSMKLRLNKSTSTLAGYLGGVNILVTTPQQKSVVHLEKPSLSGFFGCILNLPPEGPTVKSSDQDKATTVDITVDSLCLPGQYGK